MKLKVFNTLLMILLLGFMAGGTAAAQDTDSDIPAPPPVPAVAVTGKPVTITVNSRTVKTQLHKLERHLKNLNINTDESLKTAFKALENLNVNVNVSSPQIALAFKDMGDGTDYTIGEGEQSDDGDQVKNYSKIYTVDANDMLNIENRYGKVTVNTWNRNEFKVDVQIKVNSGNANDGRKALDNVNIVDSKSGSTVSFRTDIGSENSSWGSWLRGHSARKMEINYTVYMPSRNALSIDNRYGAIVIPNIEGRVNINSAYGSFAAKSLPNQSNIKVRYGSADIENLGTADLEVAYGSLDLGAADKLNTNVSYSSAKIGKIRLSGNINVRYSGGLEIGDVDKNTKNLNINSSYSNVSLGLSGDENADFDVTVHYGNFTYGDHDVTLTGKNPDDEKGFHPTKNFKGHLGKGNNGKSITVNSNYGNVEFD